MAVDPPPVSNEPVLAQGPPSNSTGTVVAIVDPLGSDLGEKPVQSATLDPPVELLDAAALNGTASVDEADRQLAELKRSPSVTERLMRVLSGSFSIKGSDSSATYSIDSAGLERNRSFDATKHSSSFSSSPPRSMASSSMDKGPDLDQASRIASSSRNSTAPALPSAPCAPVEFPTNLLQQPEPSAGPPPAPAPMAPTMPPAPLAAASTLGVSVEPVSTAASSEAAAATAGAEGTSSSSSTEARGKKKGGSMVLPAAAGIVLVLAAAGTLAWLWLRKAGKKQQQQQQQEEALAPGNVPEEDVKKAMEKARKVAAGVNAVAADIDKIFAEMDAEEANADKEARALASKPKPTKVAAATALDDYIDVEDVEVDLDKLSPEELAALEAELAELEGLE